MTDYLWTGQEEVRCEILVEPLGDRRRAREFLSTVRRIYPDGLLPLALPDGRPAEFREQSATNALARAKLFLDRRFGFGQVVPGEEATAGMKVFPLETVPAETVIAGYRRFGCRICRIGEPNPESFPYWIDYARREHGYEVVSDTLERAPRLHDVEKLFRVVRLARPAPPDPAPGLAGDAPVLPRLMPRKPRP